MVIVRLSRHGSTGKPFYRMVAADKQRWRDGKYLELLGTVDLKKNPPIINLKADRIKYWVTNGAQLSSNVRDIIRKQIPGFVEEREARQLKQLRAARKKRKGAAGKSAKKK